MPAAAIAVHQLRYWLAYGSRANAELAAQGHSYLHSLVPWTVFGIAVGTGLFLRRLARALRTRSQPTTTRLPAGGLWLATWIGLVAIYATQETLEAFLATGHPGESPVCSATAAGGRSPRPPLSRFWSLRSCSSAAPSCASPLPRLGTRSALLFLFAFPAASRRPSVGRSHRPPPGERLLSDC